MTNKDIFGELEYTYYWKGKTTFPLFGKEYTCKLSIEAEEDEEISEEQILAFQMMKENLAKVAEEVENAIFDHYMKNIETIREEAGENRDQIAPLISAKEELQSLVEPTVVKVPYNFDRREVVILLFCKWDFDYGIGIRLVDEKVEFIGVQADVL